MVMEAHQHTKGAFLPSAEPRVESAPLRVVQLDNIASDPSLATIEDQQAVVTALKQKLLEVESQRVSAEARVAKLENELAAERRCHLLVSDVLMKIFGRKSGGADDAAVSSADAGKSISDLGRVLEADRDRLLALQGSADLRTLAAMAARRSCVPSQE